MDEDICFIELESALADDCNVNDIYNICQNNPIPEVLRAQLWQVCLDVRYKTDQMTHFNGVYDLPFQNQMREDCQKIVDRIGFDDAEKLSVLSDLESILTFYCKNRDVQYESENGWIELLLPLLALKLNTSDTYNLFEALCNTYIPKGCMPKGNVFHVFRLLILYHDPELCTMLDTKKITPDLYSMQWFQSLFAAKCSLSVILSMWDLYFQQSDPFLVFFLSLLILINGREQILAMKNADKEDVVKFLTNMPCALDTEDVVDFCSLAQYYAVKTPSSFKTDFLKTLYCNQNTAQTVESDESSKVSQALCLPVSVYELVENASFESQIPDAVRFFLVDCRPAEQYNAGHLSTAFHLDCNLMLQEPQAFMTAVQGLLTAQRQSIEANSNAGGEHLCFMSSGRTEEDQYTHMVVASFLQKNTKYVSLLSGGYMSIHNYFGDQMVECLQEHNAKKCIVCSKKAENGKQNNNECQAKGNNCKGTSATSELFSKFSAVMKLKSAEMKDKLYDIIINPAAGNQQQANGKAPIRQDRHVSSAERNGKLYRNVQPVFSIDDDNDEVQQDDEHGSGVSPSRDGATMFTANDAKEIVTLNRYLKSPDIVNAFKCQEVHLNGYMYDSHLIVTPTHLIVLRDLDRGQAQVMVRRPLESIARITARKRHRDLITFKYGYANGDEEFSITDMDRFLIPDASVATALVKKYIAQTWDGTKLT